MSYYTVRIELRGSPSSEVYTKLHRAMETAGFTRTIRGDNGVFYWLPHGEYDFVPLMPMIPEGVRRYASEVVARIWTKWQVLVSRTDYRAWGGLDQVQNILYPLSTLATPSYKGPLPIFP